MKKQLTTLFLTAAALLMPFALTSCDEELQISENDGSEPKPQTETIFSSMPSDTRTSMASTADSYNKYPFYWETGDKIWVDKAKNGSFTLESGSPSINASNRQQASFVFQELLTGSTYDLVYTGSGSTRPNQVTIKNVQEQQGWNNSAHIGTSGDCATATASQTSSGNYSFTLSHKAHYLVLKPYLNTAITESCELTKIEIVADNTIAGTYQFSASGLNTGGVTSSSSTITLNCTGTMPITDTSTDACFVVLQPGTHTLTIKYTIKSLTQNGATFTFVMDAFTKNFNVNGVTTIRHELTPLLFNANYAKFGGGIYTKTSSYNSTIAAPTQLSSGSWANLPNANQLFWYAMRGDPRWDGETPWILTGGTAGVSLYGLLHKGGVWILKWQYISEASASYIPGVPSNVDLRVRNPRNARYDNTTTSYTNGGKPADTSNYFFLPAAGAFPAIGGGSGNIAKPSGVFSDTGGGLYWSKSPDSQDEGTTDNPIYYAYCLTFGPMEIACNMGNRQHGGLIVTTWWQ